MKSKFHNQIQIVNYISSTDRFKLIFILILILSLYGSLILGQDIGDILGTISITFQFSLFNIFFFAILFLNTLNTCTTFDKNFSQYIIRLKNKKNYVKELIKNVIIMNLFLLLLFFLLYFSLVYACKFGRIDILPYQNYGFSNVLYILFYLIRYIIIAMLMSMISTLCYINFKSRITVLVDAIFLLGFEATVYSASIRTNFCINPWHYFDGTLYDSFLMELSYSILFVFLLELIIFFLHFVTMKSKRWNIS